MPVPGQSCQNCPSYSGDQWSLCFRHPPEQWSEQSANWPRVVATDWCGDWGTTSAGGGGGGGGIPEAPTDGNLYGRQSAAWAAITPTPGPAGPQGDIGPQGTQGPQGPAGADGVPGPQGVPGLQGNPGSVGLTGPAGPQGPAGNDGLQGPAGPQGIQGLQGVQGDVGPAGPAGADGAPGPQGNTGPQGQQGPQGNTSSIFSYAFSTSTVAPPVTNGTVELDNATPANAANLYISNLSSTGNDISVFLGLIQTGNEILLQNADDATQYYSYTVTSEAFATQPGYKQVPVVWKAGAGTLPNNMNIILGIVSQGQQGPAGPVGPAGPQGAPGPTGATGDIGPIGPAGPQGLQGNVGPQGVQGIPGTAGIQGPAGAIGATGATGQQGPQGPQGQQGPQGIPGPTAVSANAGNQATLGSDNLIFVPLTPAASNATPTMDGTAAAGIATSWSRGDHVHPTDTSRYAASNPNGYQTAAQVSAVLPTASSTAPVMDGTAAAGVGTTFARTDHVHPSDTSRMALKGATDGGNAAAGNIGEQIAASITTAVSLTTNVTANIGSISLTPGDWAVSGVVIFTPTSAAPTALGAGVSATSATLPTVAQVAAGNGNMTQYHLSFTNGATQTMQTGVARVNVTASTTIYLVAQGTFSGGSCSATGYVAARRVAR
jgi:collagen type II alpha